MERMPLSDSHYQGLLSMLPYFKFNKLTRKSQHLLMNDDTIDAITKNYRFQ